MEAEERRVDVEQGDGRSSVQLRILTLNVWGLKFVSRKRRERIRAITDYICSPDTVPVAASALSGAGGASTSQSQTSSSLDSNSSASPLAATTGATNATAANKQQAKAGQKQSRWDVVCLQELWCSEDWEYVKNRAKQSGSGLVHGRYFWSGALGSGLCILSKYPIVATSTWPYTLCGTPLHVIEGDFFVAKACGQATLDLGPSTAPLTVLNTHFYAPGGEHGDEWQRAHRLAQAWELARLTNIAAERGQHVIVCGDLNSIPTSLVINLLISHGNLNDAWSACHPPGSENVAISASEPSAEEAITYNGITCDSPLNTWSAAKKFGEDVIRAKGKRLDYVLYRNAGRGVAGGLRPQDCTVVAMEPVRSLGCSLTDHFGVEALFEISSSSSLGKPTGTDASEPRRSSDLALEPIPSRPPPSQVITLARAAITIYSQRSFKSSHIQLLVFAMSLVGIPVLSVAASFQPIKWLNWIFVLLGIGNGVVGATFLYTGFVGGRWEKSALQNVLNDMAIELDRIGRSHG